MDRNKYQPKSHKATRICALFLSMVLLCVTFSTVAFAADGKSTVPAKVFTLEEGSKYVVGDTTPSAGGAIGNFFIEGTAISEDAKNGIPVYRITSEKAYYTYEINSKIKNREADEWHLIDHKTKKVNGFTLDENIMSGALILQTSLDGETWVDELNISDIFADNAKTSSFYDAKAVQLQNGCYYRVVIAYKMERQLEDSKILFVTKHNYEYKEVVEEYVVYAYCKTDETSPDATPQKRLGSKINTGKDNGYSGNEPIDKDDPHYGWDIGYFYINGYTREESTQDGTPVFLKNVGDKVTLWFHLSEDITKLHGNEKLTINEDSNGYDRGFEIEQTNFEHGTLIIQYTDAQGVAGDSIIYTDYLAANARTGANTKVQLFEEGDYVVSLNYEIKSMGGAFDAIASYTNYKIMFKFSIRNGNCMVYPFDTITGAELHDNAITENGFKLDMANSKYLTIDVQRSVLTVGTDGYLTEDIRFNRPAKDGEAYTSEGIYTFRVSNQYTGESTTKTIYVGSNNYLRALSATEMSIAELNEKIKAGAIVHDDGTIEVISTSTSDPQENQETSKPTDDQPNDTASPNNTTPDVKPDENNANPPENEPEYDYTPIVIIAIVIVGACSAVYTVMKKKRRAAMLEEEGGDEE